MKKEYYVVMINDWYVKNTYSRRGDLYIFVVSTDDVMKAKRYKTFKVAQKLKDRLDAYYESNGLAAGREVSVYRINVDIVLTKFD